MRTGISFSKAAWLLLTLLLLTPVITNAAGNYGYMLDTSGKCGIWWAEGAYKIMRDHPLPAQRTDEILLRCAKNEYEPFQLVLVPEERMDNVRIRIDGLRNDAGGTIGGDDISILRVGYVHITVPTDEYGGTGWYPDPLPPCDGPFTAYPGENTPLWITVHVPENAAGGTYRGAITLSSGRWSTKVPVRLEVWPFRLPDEPTIRSAFGIMNQYLRRYHNTETREELREVADLYMRNMMEHRVCATSPLSLYPMEVTVEGIDWDGGFFLSENPYRGSRCLAVDDQSVSRNAEAVYKKRIPVIPGETYTLSWFAKTDTEEHEYTVLVTGSNAEGEFLPVHNKLKVYKGAISWKQEEEQLQFQPEVASITVHLFAAFRDERGSRTGTAYFDDIDFRREGASENLLTGADFEMDISDVNVNIDFTEFDKGARRYLDELGCNSFNLGLQGLGGGTFHSRQGGSFSGFLQGTPEYERLMSDYLRQVQDHLEENGWLGREYIYWFDEPQEKDYEFVREGMKNIRKAAPKLTRFITENAPGPEIMDVAEISCLAFRKVDPEFIAEQVAKGEEFWSYLSTGTRRKWVTHFIDHPAINMRMWLWMSYQYKLIGILDYLANYWSSDTVFPEDMLQNPWEDPMSYRVGYGTPFGQVNYWGNGDGRLLYPPNRSPNSDKSKYICGPINSIRWEIMREGIEDYEYFCLLRDLIENVPESRRAAAERAARLLDFPDSLFTSGEEFTKDPQMLLKYRERIAEAIIGLQ